MHPKAQGQPQLHPVRQPADRRQVRGAHGPLHRGQEQLEPGRARGDDVEGGRRPAVLLPPARHGRGGGGGARRQRLLQGGAAGAADGVRHGGAAAGGDLPRRVGRLTWRRGGKIEMIVSTTPNVEGRRVARVPRHRRRRGDPRRQRLPRLLRRDPRHRRRPVGRLREALREARETALDELEAEAARLGGDAVVGVDLDYEVVGKDNAC